MTLFSISLSMNIDYESNKLLSEYHRKFIRPEIYEYDYETINIE